MARNEGNIESSKEGRGGRGRPINGDGSPITIGGGGGLERGVELYVTIEFDHNDYVPDPKDQDNFRNTDFEISGLYINDRVVPGVDNDSEIKVSAKKSGTATVIITASPLGVSFKGNDFPYDHNSKKHYGAGRTITKVTVDGKQVFKDIPIFKVQARNKAKTAMAIGRGR